MYISIRPMDGGYLIERTDLESRPQIKQWVRSDIEAMLDLIKEIVTDLPAGVVDALLMGESEEQEEEAQDEGRT